MTARAAAALHPAKILFAALVLSVVPPPRHAHAAFELRDASPAALGAASTDGAWLPFLDEENPQSGWRLGGSRATIFGAEGLGMSEVYAAARGGPHAIRLAWATLSGAGARESAARFEVAENGGRSTPAVSLGACAERLDFAPEGLPRWGGWTLGGSARASAGPRGRGLGVWVRGDRLLRTGALERAGVASSVEIGASLRAGGSTLAMLDRWERDASHSPRVALELPLGEAARIRFARGAAPGRIGAAVKLRLGKLEVAWGRLDYAFGGTIAALQVGLTSQIAAAPARNNPAIRAALLVPEPSAIMRPHAGIALIEGLEAAPESGTGRIPARSEPGWLPAPEEELESLEPLAEEPSSRGGILVRGAISEGRLRMRRVAAFDRGRATRWEAGLLEEDGRWRPGAVVAPGKFVAAAGRVSVAQAPTLFAESMRWTRSVSRVGAPRAGAINLAPSRGASAAALDGAALSVRGDLSCWALAGRRSEGGERVAAVGLWHTRGRARYAAAFGALEPLDGLARGGALAAARLCGSFTVVRRGSGSETSVELFAARDRRAALAALERRSGPALLSARWRYRSWAARKVAAELSAAAVGSASRARLLWRTWAEGASADDGLLEIEGETARWGAGPIRIRAGARGFGDRDDGAVSRERYALVEATVARDHARSLSFRASRRESSRSGSRAVGQTVGARLGAVGESLGDHALLIEATRLRNGAAAAWGSSLHASGAETLRARSRSGLWLAARGAFGGRRWRFGYALERGEDVGGARPWSGTVWLRLGHTR